MNLKTHALNARFLIVSIVFLVSACVIGNTKVDDAPKPEQPATADAKAEPKLTPRTEIVDLSVKIPGEYGAPRFVNVSTLNVRSRPSFTAPVVGKLPRGAKVS